MLPFALRVIFRISPLLFIACMLAMGPISTLALGQDGEVSHSLISRKEFFAGPSLLGFQCDEAGEHLYFQTPTSRDEVRFLSIAKPEQIQTIPLGSAATSWMPVAEGVLCVQSGTEQVSVALFSRDGQKRTVDSSFSIRSASLLAISREGREVAMLDCAAADSELSGLYALDLETLTLDKRYESQPYASLFFDGHLKLVAAHGPVASAGNQLMLYDSASNGWSSFREHPWSMDDSMLGGLSRILSVSNDGDRIFFTSNRDSDKCRLYQLDQSSGETELLAEHPQVDLLPFGASINRRGEVTSIVGLYAETKRVVIDPSWQEDFSIVDEQIEGDVSFLRSCDNDRVWIVRELRGGPIRMYAYDRDSKELTYLISDWPSLEGKQLAKRQAFDVETRDGLHLPVHVYLPVGSDTNQDGIPDEPLPTVLYVHGGPWVGIVHWNQDFHWRNFQLLANRGYAVINCEFRGSIGLGKEFVESARKAWKSKMTLDKVDIARWAVDSGIAKSDKVGIWGWSYGGYAALAGVAFSPDTYACGVSMYGISNMESFASSSYVNNEFWHTWVGNPNDDADRQMLRDASPIQSVNAIKAPVLMTTGSQDVRVPQQQMDSMAEALDQAGKEVVYFYYPDEAHDYRAPESWISFWSVTEVFLATHLGGRYEPDRGDRSQGNLIVVKGQPLFDSLEN